MNVQLGQFLHLISNAGHVHSAELLNVTIKRGKQIPDFYYANSKLFGILEFQNL